MARQRDAVVFAADFGGDCGGVDGALCENGNADFETARGNGAFPLLCTVGFVLHFPQFGKIKEKISVDKYP